MGQIRFETVFGKNTPLSFIFALQKILSGQFTELKSQIPLKEGGKFSVAAYNDSQIKLGALLQQLNPGERFRFVYLEPSLRECQPEATPPTVNVVYRIFTTESLSFLTSIFERPQDRLTRPALVPLRGSDQNKLLPQPYLGYNRSRGVFGGTRASFKSAGGIFNRADLDVSGSGSSAAAELSFAGSRSFDAGIVNYAEWRLGYRYANIPADAVRLKDGTLLAQFFGGTRPLGAHNLVLRFGASLEGGNRQTEFAENLAVPPAELANSEYGAAKFYLGGTVNWGRQAWTSSYGLQLGQSERGARISYVKQIVDTAYTVRFLPREHLPLRVEAQFTAGLIHSASGRIPIGERFFGGNVARDFIQGGDWRIRSSPLIRSFPQYRLNRIDGEPIGGENFFSVNLTLAQALWYRSAVPEEIARLPELRIKLSGQITTERENAKDSYLHLSPDFGALMQKLNELEAVLGKLQSKLGQINSPPPPILAAVNAFSELDEVNGVMPLPQALEAVANSKQDKTEAMSNVTALAQDFPVAKSLITILLEDISALQKGLSDATLADPGLTEVADGLKRLQGELQSLRDKVNKIQDYIPSDVQQVVEKVNELPAILQRLQPQLQRLPPPSASDPEGYAFHLEAVTRYVEAATKAVAAANSNETNVRDAERLAVGFGEVSPALITGIVSNIRSLQKALIEKDLADEARTLEDEAKNLLAAQSRIKDSLKPVRVPQIERLANRDIRFTGRVLDVIFRELNMVAVSPVVMFDAARIGPQKLLDSGGVRYGVGTGVRFSLVTLDLTLGYSWNLNRRPGEGRGAFVFSLDVADLFR